MATNDTTCLHCGFRMGDHSANALGCPIPDGLKTKLPKPIGIAGYFVEKVEAGQVWHDPVSGNSWEITSVRDGSAYGNPVGSRNRDVHFGEVDKNQRPTHDWSRWICKSVNGWNTTTATKAVEAKAIVQDDRQAELAFFKSTQPGQCVCGIPRERCDYHRA